MSEFFNKHFGSIITAIVTLVVSFAAIYVSIKQVEISEQDSDRQWRIEAAKFIAQNHGSIFRGDNKTRERFFEIIELAYPPELSAKLRLQMFDQYTIETKDVLITFLQPDGEKIHTQNNKEFTDWLKTNKPELLTPYENLADTELIKTIMINTNYADMRRKIAKDLDLKNRVIEYGDLHKDVVDKKKNEFENKGSEVFYGIQNDGNYKMTVIKPK